MHQSKRFLHAFRGIFSRFYRLLFNALRVFLSMSVPDGLSVSGVKLRKFKAKINAVFVANLMQVFAPAFLPITTNFHQKTVLRA